MLTLSPKSGMVSSQIHFGGTMLGLFLTLIIIGLVVSHFGFWTVVGSFFVGLLSIIGIVIVVVVVVFAVIAIADALT